MQGTAALYGFWKVICSVEKLEKMGQKTDPASLAVYHIIKTSIMKAAGINVFSGEIIKFGFQLS